MSIADFFQILVIQLSWSHKSKETILSNSIKMYTTPTWNESVIILFCFVGFGYVCVSDIVYLCDLD